LDAATPTLSEDDDDEDDDDGGERWGLIGVAWTWRLTS
jgi:hypothetical protein